MSRRRDMTMLARYCEGRVRMLLDVTLIIEIREQYTVITMKNVRRVYWKNLIRTRC